MLHSNDYLLWNFLLFENYGQEVGGPIHCWSPTWKLGDQSPPVPTVVAPMPKFGTCWSHQLCEEARRISLLKMGRDRDFQPNRLYLKCQNSKTTKCITVKFWQRLPIQSPHRSLPHRLILNLLPSTIHTASQPDLCLLTHFSKLSRFRLKNKQYSKHERRCVGKTSAVP